jgi:hypothetical protein
MSQCIFVSIFFLRRKTVNKKNPELNPGFYYLLRVTKTYFCSDAIKLAKLIGKGVVLKPRI